MMIIYLSDETLLRMLEQQAQSPEEFLIELEEKLESGELTEDEVVQLVKDFTSRS
jgi:hypothetical protein